MKLKLVLFVVILFLTVIGVKAQPLCSSTFNPFNNCYYSTNPEIVFYGRVVSIESVENEAIPMANLKVKVEVENVFKGKLPQKVEMYLTRGCDFFIHQDDNTSDRIKRR